ncbi:prolyl oligopeptidase family serine peptidase [Natrialbaceae archaeon A-CW2]
MNGPPATRREKLRYERHGVVIDDPYRWLEDGEGNAEEISDWVDTQNEYADEYLESASVRESLRPEFEALAEITEYGTISARKTGYFQEVERPDDDQAVLTHRPSLEADRSVLLDPNEWSDDGTVSMGWWSPSPAGDRLAYGVDEAGNENYDVTVIEIASGDVIDELPELGRCHSVAWTASGLYYYRTGSADQGGQLEKSVHYHEFGADPEDDELLYEITDPSTWPQLQTDRSGRHLLLTLVSAWEKSELLYAPVTTGSHDLTPVLEDTENLFMPLVYGDTAYLRTNLEAPTYRLLSLDLAEIDGPVDPTTLPEVLAPREGILQNSTIAGERLLCRYETAAVSELEVFDLEGSSQGRLPLPGLGTVTGLSGNRDAPEAFFGYESFDQPPAVFRAALPADEDDNTTMTAADESGATLEELDRPDLQAAVDLEVKQVWYDSTDGAEVPMFVIHREGLELDGDNPALLYGYGGFEISVTPSYTRFGQAFLRSGGVYAVGNFRGGGEFGKEWHRAARHERKQHTFDDMIAAAASLIERGYTSSDRLAIQGGSNGGLTVGAVMTQRPDLVRAVLCHVPLLDMLQFHTFLLGESWTTEYGSPEDEAAFEWIYEYSPYHNLEERGYPAVLFKTAESDTRVHPVHAWKMAARMQAYNTGEHPILCKTARDTGHGTGKPTWMVVEEALDTWSFVFEELGLEYVEP